MRRSIANKFITFLSAVFLLSLFLVSKVFARYTSVNDSHAVSFDVVANYYATFDANGGIFNANSVSDACWTNKTDSSVSKIIMLGSQYGSLPVPERDGYYFEGWNAAYRPVEYLCTQGNSYIDTGIKANIDYSYKVRVMGTTEEWIMGARDDTYWGVNIMTNNFDFYGSSENERWYNKNCISSKIYDISIENRELHISCNGIPEQVYNSKQGDSFTGSFGNADEKYGSQRNMYLFAENAPDFNKARRTANSGVRIYSASISDKDGNLLLNMIPAEKLSDGTFGMFDTVSGNFFEKQGSGSPFTAGPVIELSSSAHVFSQTVSPNDSFDFAYDCKFNAVWSKYCTVKIYSDDPDYVSEVKIPKGHAFLAYITDIPQRDGYTFAGWKTDSLPSNIQELEYVMTDGTSYINTGLITNINYEYNITQSGPRDSFLMGARGAAYYGVNFMTHIVDFYGTSSAARYQQSSFSDKTVYTYNIKNKTLTVTADGKTIDTHTFTGFNTTTYPDKEMYIFGVNGGAASCKAGSKIYGAYVKNAEGDYLIDLVPCRKKNEDSSYEYGFFDRVSQNFMGSSGLSGNNTAANEILITENSVVENSCSIYAIWEEN